ncbi:Arginyl-tRNA synthetase [Thermodesulfobium narugense DSM 14796]|uniref:Arginine--tRNA ligase n=1 Tax=Thermodesulfobium narugense DSM 14796 TaxID=747365 RepID=M1E6X4_9BACT|nr:arginine--tRNA ligase [Thermodesulfobium narugense]AEE14358.1 Arginyl-tRNA synthetase [Thermodesulfobium narugense DSM 14796]
MSFYNHLKKETQKHITKLYPEIKNPASFVEIQISNPQYGDYTILSSMKLAKHLKEDPIKIANKLAQSFKDDDFSVQVANPGFINISLKEHALQNILQNFTIEPYLNSSNSKTILIEYVSANPTGPLHIGHARWAAFGDSLTRILKDYGFNVQTEFYVNNYGNQMELFTLSIIARMREILKQDYDFPEGGYQGEYVVDIAKKILNKYPFLSKDDQNLHFELIKEEALNIALGEQKETLKNFGVIFDSFFFESSLHQENKINKIIELLISKNQTYKKDGALWLKTSNYFDSEDRVLIRENGLPTYFAADIAYHYEKFKRNFDIYINIWGTDHHGYIPRLKSALKALDLPEEKLVVLLGQLVNLYKNKNLIRMSKRTGNMITLKELLEDVGHDILRFYLTSRSLNSTIDFHIEKAKEVTMDNPLYYIQYACARISSIRRNIDEEIPANLNEYSKYIKTAEEYEIIKKIDNFDFFREKAVRDYEPYYLVNYMLDLARLFHIYYQKNRIINQDKSIQWSRLFLILKVHNILSRGLSYLNIIPMEKM